MENFPQDLNISLVSSPVSKGEIHQLKKHSTETVKSLFPDNDVSLKTDLLNRSMFEIRDRSSSLSEIESRSFKKEIQNLRIETYSLNKKISDLQSLVLELCKKKIFRFESSGRKDAGHLY